MRQYWIEEPDESCNITTSKISLSELYSYILYFAAERGYMNVIQFIVRKVMTNISIDDIQPQFQPNALRKAEKDNNINSTRPILIKSFTTSAIYNALRNGYLDIAKLLLTLPNDDPTLKHHYCYLSGAVRHFNVIKFLLFVLPGVDVTEMSVAIFGWACRWGQVHTIKFLLSKFPDIVTFPYFTSHLRQTANEAARRGFLDVMELLLVLEFRKYVNLYTALDEAVKWGRLDIVKRLVNLLDINFAYRDNYLLFNAVKEHRFNVVRFLVRYSEVDAGVEDNLALRVVAKCGDLDLVKVLVGLKGVDPTARKNEAVRNAALGGHEKVVRFLITFPGVDLRACNDYVFRMGLSEGRLDAIRIWLWCSGVCASRISQYFLYKAIDWGNWDVVKMLVAFPGVDVTLNNNAALRNAAKYGKARLLQILMGVHGVDLSLLGKDALTVAASKRHFDVLKLLLAVPGVFDASLDDSRVLKMAATWGKVDIMKLLLMRPEVDVTVGDYCALGIAAARGYVGIVRLLLEAGVDPTVGDNEAFILAAERRHVEVVKVLLGSVGGESNEFVGMVGKVGAEGFINMFEGKFDRKASENTTKERRERAINTLRTLFGGL
ncbi:hypothetical protein HDU76_000524 [Blyttiomyces sp. JEL0837]|nr:hypothetical protein HDU76_000524 [Blyttiomyces sp. JEL0837]